MQYVMHFEITYYAPIITWREVLFRQGLCRAFHANTLCNCRGFPQTEKPRQRCLSQTRINAIVCGLFAFLNCISTFLYEPYVCLPTNARIATREELETTLMNRTDPQSVHIVILGFISGD